jgi:hypothetical protein
MFAPVFLPLNLHYCPQSNSRLHINFSIYTFSTSICTISPLLRPSIQPPQNCLASIYRVHLPTFLDFILSILFCLYFLDSLLHRSVIGFIYLPTSFLSTPLFFCISYDPCCNIRHLDSPQSPSLSLCFALALALAPALALALHSSVTPTT